MRQFLWALFFVPLITSGCGSADEPPSVVAIDHGAAVRALADEAWQRLKADSAYLQVRAGELPTRISDVTPEQTAENAAFARTLLERLNGIPAGALEHEDQLTASILAWDAEMVIALEPFHWLQFPYTPYLAGFAFNFAHGQMAAHPFTDAVAHPENYLTFVGEYADLLDQIRAHLDGQIERGVYVSRHALPAIVGVFESYREAVPGIVAVSDERLDGLSDDERAAFLASLDELIEARVRPGLDAIVEVLGSEEYAANAPDAVGLAHYPDGPEYYRALVRFHTTTDVTPEELHQLGKRRLAEIEAEMASIREEVGFEGTKVEFHETLRSDPQFFASSADEVEATFQTYIDRIEPLVPDYFAMQPEAPYGVRRLDPALEASMTFGYYQAPTPDEPTGLYLFNGSKLDERPQIWAGPLIYHELVPGHHFHIALVSENESLPMYRREYSGSTAFVEGWGNYGALLAGEMGLLDDSYDRYGALLFDAFIANRLVVDTGMNALGWTLEEGREHMREHTLQSETEVISETLRYSTDLQGQALAYKAGLERLVALREKARAKAGDEFDIRDFHDAVLGSGTMPMVVLEDHVDWYFGERGPAAPEVVNQ